jgi:hypothetical protein
MFKKREQAECLDQREDVRCRTEELMQPITLYSNDHENDDDDNNNDNTIIVNLCP